jgi:AraC-like DNA-binding protein
MESPIKTEYQSEIISIKDVTGSLPKDCLFPISYAKAELTELKAGTILRQYVSNYHFYMEMYELNLHIPLKICSILEKPTMFMVFMLLGTLDFYSANGEHIARADKNTCYAFANRAGRHVSHYSEGRHCLLYIVFRVDWIMKNPERYPKLIDFLKSLETYELLSSFLPKCHIAGFIKEALYDLYKLKPIEGEIFEDILAIKCKHLIIKYHEALLYKLNMPLYRVKTFIEENYINAELSNEKLADEFDMTSKTLIRNFKTEFGIAPHAYLIQVRMNLAKQMLTKNEFHINTIYAEVGYGDFRSFSKQFKKFFGFPPSGYR